MGKLKPRIKGKGKRWPKGQSSNSNPSITKFRDAAKTRFFTPNIGTNRVLTVGALKTHDAFNQPEKPGSTASSKNCSISEFSDCTSQASSASFKTFASVYSNCSNVSFTKLLQNFQPHSAIQKEMLAVLAAVTEIIEGEGGTGSTTEYFAALMTSLDAEGTEDSTAAILSLISMGIKNVNQEVLREKFSNICKSILEVLSLYSESENFVIIRAAIGILSVVLRAQDLGVWADSSTLNVFQSILVFTTYSKPKVRKIAQHAVCAILKGSQLIPGDSNHPAAASTAKFCIQKIEESTSVGGGTTTLHVLTLLNEVLPTFPKDQIKSACEVILKLLTLGKVMVTKCSFQALHGLFISNPPAFRLTPTLNAKLINALYNYQPALTDWETVMAWVSVMQEAYRNLVRIDPGLCAENLLKLFNTINNIWLTDNPKLLANATCALRTVTLDCLGQCKDYHKYEYISKSIFAAVEGGLKYQYHNAWGHVLNILGALFEVLGVDAESYAGPCLKSLADLRDSYNFKNSFELEYTVGKAIRTLGPEMVLKHIPLNITGHETNYEFKRTWLLPVLKDNIQTASLESFSQYFLPLANICSLRSQELKKGKDTVGSHSYELLSCQIWALFPCYCNNPNDIAKNFPILAKHLGVILNSQKQLRLSVLSGLRKLITKCQENSNEEGLKVLGHFAKNYLPILFNLYTTKPAGTDEEGQRLAVYDTIKVYFSVTSKELCGTLFAQGLKLLETSENNSFIKESVMDIIKAVLPYLAHNDIEKVYNICLQHLKKAENPQEEKKAYRLLEDLCSSEEGACRDFMVEKIPEVQKLLLKSLNRKGVSNAGARLRCLRHLIHLIPKNQYNVVVNILPEAVLRCKDANARTRSCAFEILTDMLEISKKWSAKSGDEITRDYFSILLGGLTGSPTLVAATLVALAKLTFVLRDELPSDIQASLLENVSLLLKSPSREITSACLGYVNTFISSYRKEIVLVHIPLIVSGIVSMTDDGKRHSRIKIRDILHRLLRKFGYDVIKVFIPEDDAVMQKRLKNLRKINDRKKKLKDAAMEAETEDDIDFSAKKRPKSIEEILASSDESDLEEEIQPQKGNRRKKQAQMFIREDEDDIVDLVSPGAAGKLTSTQPLKQAVIKDKQKEPSFKKTPDGRLIITKDLEEPKTTKRENISSDDDDNDLDDVSSVFSQVNIGAKRKRAASSVASVTSSKYQPGGSGIHRPTAAKMAKKAHTTQDDASIKSGKEYRAKKAKGDLKIKGKLDPYAYIPLSRKMLSKRKKAKMSSKFKNVISSAVKGARTGSKIRRRK